MNLLVAGAPEEMLSESINQSMQITPRYAAIIETNQFNTIIDGMEKKINPRKIP